MNFLSHTGSTVRKSVLDKVGNHNGGLSYLHDFDLWTRIIINYPIYVFKDNLAFYRRTDSSNSSYNIRKLKIHNFEQALIAYRMINSCPDDLFLRTFSDKLRFKGNHTHEETEIEKAFLLSDGIYAYKGNKLLSALKFAELFSNPEYVEIAREKFNFTLNDFQELESKNLFYDFCETDALKDEIKNKDAQIENLKEQLNGFNAALSNSNKFLRFTVEYNIYRVFKALGTFLKHIKNFIFISKKDGM